MKIGVTIISFLFCLKSSLFAQRNISKDEIYKYWRASEMTASQDSLGIWLDKNTKFTIREQIDSLQNLKIDSLIVYSVSYPGYFGKTDCLNGLYPIYTYIIWKSNRHILLKKIEGKCLFSVKIINSTILFKFYDEYQKQILSDFIMPAIYSGQIDSNNKITYSESWVDHEAKYFLYFKLGHDSKVAEFSENDLINEKSLFHKDNLSLKLYEWWNVIKNLTDQR